MATIFTKIANKEIPSYKVAEDDNFYAFLDINPKSKGHTLVIPKHVENDYLFSLEDKLYSELMVFTKKVAIAIKEAIPCNRVAMAVIGLEVPHTHIHLIPINEEGDMDFKKKSLELSNEEFKNISSSILTAYEKI